MLPKIWLAVALILCYGVLCGQADSLSWAADSLLIAKSYRFDFKDWAYESLSSKDKAWQPFAWEIGDLYYSGFFHLARPNLRPAMHSGFETQAFVFSPGLYHSYFSSFYGSRNDSFNANYCNKIYPFEPPLSSIHALLGDYEHRFARISLAKHGLFSYSGLGYQGELLAQNGFWADQMSAETSHKHYLSLESGKWTIEAEYADWERDIGMNELLPVYWQPTGFPIGHSYRQIFAALSHPLFRLAALHTSETARSNRFFQSLENNSTQLQLAYDNNTGVNRYRAIYEHSFNKANVRFAQSFTNERYEDKVALSFDKYMPYGVSLYADCLDWQRGKVALEAGYPLGAFTVGAYGNLLWGKDITSVTAQDIYNASGEFELLNVVIEQEQAAYLGYEWLGMQLKLAAGSKRIVQSADSPGFDQELFLPLIKIGLDAEVDWKNWGFQAAQSWTWTQFNSGLCENPEFRFAANQEVLYNLPYNNSLLGGFALQGHSGYYAANVINPVLIEASTALDLWLGFRIDDLFELSGGFKNLLSSTLYGSMPVPLSAYVELKWFYFN